MGEQAGETAQVEAVLGEIVHDRGEEPETGWFIVGAHGYFDVDNAIWCEPQEDDAPWTSEWFHLCGTVADLIADGPARAVTYVRAQDLPVRPGATS